MNPLSTLYGGATALRNTLFDHGALRSRRLQRPVVSVGNLSVGGSGKTPFVIALGELFHARGIRFDVLSRGYRRKTSGVLVVDPDGNAASFGDEPLLIARRLQVPVVVGESRYEAGRVAEAKYQSQLHILDDGFQHRSLARSFDIVLLTERDFDDTLLPCGRLREPLSSLARADAIVLPKSMLTNHPPLPQRLVWRVESELALPDRISSHAAPIAFCGIARPEQFFAQLRAAGIVPAAEIAFRDHHAYSKADINRLLALRGKRGAGGFLTTEKDAINLGPERRALEPLGIATLKLTLDHPTAIVDAILARTISREVRPS